MCGRGKTVRPCRLTTAKDVRPALGPANQRRSTQKELYPRIERVEERLFEGEESVLHVIERIVAPLGLRVDGSSLWVDVRLPDGSRVHAIVPPLSLCGPVLGRRRIPELLRFPAPA